MITSNRAQTSLSPVFQKYCNSDKFIYGNIKECRKMHTNRTFSLFVIRSTRFKIDKYNYSCAVRQKYNIHSWEFSPSSQIQLGYGLQSWKYFYKFDKQLRKQLTFRKHIKDAAEQEINKILQKRNIKSRQNITLVGVHIRRGDKVGNNDGFNIATPEYLNRSVNYYVTKYKFVLFIVISDGMKWSKDNMPSHVPIEYVSLGKRDLDMATVVACDHTIMTIGTFGWWIGYLTNGEVVYLKDAAKKGSRFERILNHKDHFYPHWIGL
ncbi:FUT1_2 [Mytilus edulis]|uniref:L-Fucosyltransferase n=1 Tax=Mytilus edulis TaxID=6550 RepID=A0A8S3VKX6_MYTED|nr:FUT1_2 [Mytilus edulis]